MNLSDATGFDWDEHNTAKNRDKHGVEPVECEEVFFNQPLIANEDVKHSQSEARYQVLGTTDEGRRLFLVITHRNRKIRIISARDMSRKERAFYEEQTPEHP